MPLYEYLCEACGRTIEAIQSFSERPLKRCDRCGGPLRKLLSAPAMQFKGSGWYLTDYGRGGAAGKKPAGSGEDGKATAETKESRETKDAKASPPATASEPSKPKSGDSGS